MIIPNLAQAERGNIEASICSAGAGDAAASDGAGDDAAAESDDGGWSDIDEQGPLPIYWESYYEEGDARAGMRVFFLSPDAGPDACSRYGTTTLHKW